MSFFDNTKNFGWLMTVAALVAFVFGIVGIVTEATGGDTIDVIKSVAIGVANLLVLLFAIGVVRGRYLLKIGRFVKDASASFGVLCGFITVNGVASLIMGITAITSGATPTGMLSGIFLTVIGAVSIIMAIVMTSRKGVSGNKAAFAILILIFILMVASGILSLLTGIFVTSDGPVAIVVIAVAVVIMLEGIFALAFLTSPNTRKELGF